MSAYTLNHVNCAKGRRLEATDTNRVGISWDYDALFVSAVPSGRQLLKHEMILTISLRHIR